MGLSCALLLVIGRYRLVEAVSTLLVAAFTIATMVAVIALLLSWGKPWHACIVAALLLAQLAAMVRLSRDPKRHAPWYNATGVMLYVLGMLASAFALGGLA